MNEEPGEYFDFCVRLVGYTDSVKDIVIPDEIDGYPVVSVCLNQIGVLELCYLNSVTLPASVSEFSLGRSSWKAWIDTLYYQGTKENFFLNNIATPCVDINKIYVDGELLIVTEYNGATYYGVESYLFYVFAGLGENFTTLHPDTKIIGVGAFGNVTIERLDLSDFGILLVSKWAFSHNTHIKEIILPNTVTTIDEYAFYGCNNLTSITLGKSIKEIRYNAFEKCSNLTNVYIDDIAGWCEMEGAYNLMQYECNLYLHGQVITELIIPDGVTKIGIGAFENCTRLISVEIPSSVTSIGSSAFSGCSSLTSITIPSSVTSIGSSAFSGCSSLTSITIPDTVTYIGRWALAGCCSLESMILPFPEWSRDYIYSIYPFGGFFDSSSYEGSVAITQRYDSYWGIESETFYIPSSLKSLTITSGVLPIYAFENCSMLTSIMLSDSVTGIGNSTFNGCSNLTVYYYSETQPTTTGNYWHYVDGVPTKW